MKKTISFAIVMLAMALFAAAAWPRASAQPAKSGAADLYAKHCAKCHGADGKGIKSLETPDMTDPKWQAAHTDKKISTVLANGEGVMPGFKGTLSAAQLASLVKHVRAFAPKAAKPAKK
jgi:mono/diheme cytochrome c family protein